MKNILETTNLHLEAYGGTNITTTGQINLKCLYKNRGKNLDFVIVDINSKPILGLDACEQLLLIKRLDSLGSLDKTNYNVLNEKDVFLKKYQDIFEGIGKFPDKLKIKIQKGANPIAMPPHRIPLSIKDRLLNKLNDLEIKGIISKLNEPVEWLSNLVIVEKPDKSLRLCMDPKELNKVIEREYFLIPTLEEISVKLQGKKYFTVLDFKDGYYQVELDVESSKLCSFSSPFGSYKFNRLPFGLSLAPEWFQKINEKYFGNIKGVIIYFDDLLIAAENEQEHDNIVKQVINKA